MESLRKRLEQQEYDSLVRNIKPTNRTPLFSDEGVTTQDSKMVKNQLSAIINIFFSMVSVFVAIFVWMRNSPDYLVTIFNEGLIHSESYGVYSLR